MEDPKTWEEITDKDIQVGHVYKGPSGCHLFQKHCQGADEYLCSVSMLLPEK